MAAKRSLLEDSDDDGADGGNIGADFKINEAFARRLEHNKKREDLHRLQELQKRGLADSETDSDDDDDEDEDGLLPESTEVQILDTLARIKKKDPVIYKPDVKFFEEGEDVEENAGRNEEPKKKPVYLKDVIARQALEDPENKEEEEVLKRRLPKTYAEEQQELKDAFLKSVSEADAADGEGGAGLFKIRKKSTEEEQYRGDGDGEQKKKDAAISHRLEEYFGKDDDLDEHDKFLKDYLLNQGWIDKEKGKLPSYSEIVSEVSDDEAELEKQDRYEAEYNFRFEEGAGDQVLGHSRFVDNSVRKVPEKRKEQRKKKQERVSEVEQARREELKRLKNVKKKEIFEKISKIKTVAGITSLDKLAEEDLEEDFDPTEYDKKMHDMFGENYYNDEDPDANFQSDEEIQLDKPDFDAEDDALGLPEGWDGRMKVGFAAVHDKQKCSTDKADASKGSSEEKLSVVDKEEIEKKLEEYYKLDYEDMVGDLPTRFKYTQVKPSKFGLSVSQILDAEDTELNRFVSLKALAPYRTEEWVPKHKHHRINKKERKRRALDQIPTIKGKKQKHEKSSEAEPLKKDSEVDNSEQNKESMAGENQKQGTSKKKQKRRKKGLGLSYNRLVSYGKVDLPKRKRRKA